MAVRCLPSQSDRQIHPVIPGRDRFVTTGVAAFNTSSSGVWSLYPSCGSEMLQQAAACLMSFLHSFDLRHKPKRPKEAREAVQHTFYSPWHTV